MTVISGKRPIPGSRIAPATTTAPGAMPSAEYAKTNAVTLAQMTLLGSGAAAYASVSLVAFGTWADGMTLVVPGVGSKTIKKTSAGDIDVSGAATLAQATAIIDAYLTSAVGSVVNVVTTGSTMSITAKEYGATLNGTVISGTLLSASAPMAYGSAAQASNPPPIPNIIPTLGVPFVQFYNHSTFNGVRDDVLYYGYNLAPGAIGIRLNASEPALWWGLESHYYDTSNRFMEYNLDYINTSGVQKRFAAFAVNRTTDLSSWLFVSTAAVGTVFNGPVAANSRAIVAAPQPGAVNRNGSIVLQSSFNSTGEVLDAVRLTHYTTGGVGYGSALSSFAVDMATAADTWSTKFSVGGNGSVGVGTTQYANYGPAAENLAAYFIVEAASTSTTVGGNHACVLRNSNTTTNNCATLGFATSDGAGVALAAFVSAQFKARQSSNWVTADLIFGTGTVGGAPAECARLTNLGNFCLGVTTAGSSAKKCLVLSNAATAPSASADMAHLYAADTAGAGTAGLAIWAEVAAIAAAGVASTHKIPILYNGTTYNILATTA